MGIFSKVKEMSENHKMSKVAWENRFINTTFDSIMSLSMFLHKIHLTGYCTFYEKDRDFYIRVNSNLADNGVVWVKLDNTTGKVYLKSKNMPKILMDSITKKDLENLKHEMLNAVRKLDTSNPYSIKRIIFRTGHDGWKSYAIRKSEEEKGAYEVDINCGIPRNIDDNTNLVGYHYEIYEHVQEKLYGNYDPFF